MGLFRKPTPIQGKLKLLEKELSLIESDIATLSKTLSDPESPATELPRLKSAEYRKEDPRPVSRRVETAPAPAAAPALPAVQTFSTRAQDLRSSVPPAPEPAPLPDRMAAGRPALRDERFADYLSASMGALSPNRREKKIQRNKALLMIFFLVLLLLMFLYHFVAP